MTSLSRKIEYRLLTALMAAGMMFHCHSQILVAQGLAQPPARSSFDYINTGNCVNCHTDRASIKEHDDFIDVAPAEVWSKHDKHSQAFELLKDSKLTNQILGFDLRDAFEDKVKLTSLSDDEQLKFEVETVKSCLRCHATRPREAEDAAGKLSGRAEPLARGVSCQACHGPAGEWELAHSDKWWRLVSHQAKSKLRFTNVRDPVVRTELCASCHVGSVKEGKFVKHEWYAAGHPPLPGFEYSAFAAQMPIHWKPLAEKGDFAGRTATVKPDVDAQGEWIASLRRRNIDVATTDIKRTYREANFPLAKDDAPFTNLPRTQDVTLSGIVVLKTYAELAGDYADESSKGNKLFPWPEFALYDCAACHHELRRQGGLASRPARRGPPGRPPMPRWTSALLGLASEHAAEVNGDLRALELAFTERPFGSPQKIAAAAQKLTPRLNQLCQELSSAKFDDERTAKALAILLNSGGTADVRDYASARQIAWAIQSLRQDQERIPYAFAPPLSAPQRQAQDRIAALFHRDGSDALLLILPAQRNPVVDNLPEFLRAMGNYDAEWFAERLTLLKKEQPKSE